jgi:ribonuclease P protein component
VNASVPARSKQSEELRCGPARFPHSARLLRHSDFERVYKQGRRHFSANLTVFYLPRKTESSSPRTSNAAPGLRVGFTVGRALGGAVERNRLKRRLREAVRLSWPVEPSNADVVIHPKKTVSKIEFETLLNEVRRAFVVIQQKLGNASDFGGKTDKNTSGAQQ